MENPVGGANSFTQEPAVPQTIGRAGQLDAAIFVRCEYAQVVEFAGFCIIAGVPHLKTNIGEAVMGELFSLMISMTGRLWSSKNMLPGSGWGTG